MSHRKKKYNSHLRKKGPVVSKKVGKTIHGHEKLTWRVLFNYEKRSTASTVAIALSPLSMFLLKYQYFLIPTRRGEAVLIEGTPVFIIALFFLLFSVFTLVGRTIVDIDKEKNTPFKLIHIVNFMLFSSSLIFISKESFSIAVCLCLFFLVCYTEVHLRILWKGLIRDL